MACKTLFLTVLVGTGAFASGAFATNVCDEPGLECSFDGLNVSAIGEAVLALDQNLDLVVSNIGSSGEDGVEFPNRVIGTGESGDGLATGNIQGSTNLSGTFDVQLSRQPPPPAVAPLSGHEEWIELGIFGVAQEAPPGAGSFMNFKASANISGQTGARDVNVQLLQNAGDMTITFDFSNVSGIGSVEFELGGTTCSTSSAIASITVGSWPTEQAFGLVTWPGTVSAISTSCNLGSLSGSGTVLEIRPSGGLSVDSTVKVLLTAKNVPPLLGGGSDLSSFTVTSATFGNLLPVPDDIPSLTEWGILAMTLMVMAGMGVILQLRVRRREKGRAHGR